MKRRDLVTAPVAVERDINFERLANTVNYYANGEASVIIFKYGTCIFPPIGAGAIENSKNLMSELGDDISFEVQRMDDGNYVVKFSDYIFSVVFEDDFLSTKDIIENDIKNSTENEVIYGNIGAISDHLLIGVFARTRLIYDLEELSVVGSIGTSRS